MKKKIYIFVLLITITEILYQIGYKFVDDNLNPFAVMIALFSIELVLITIFAFIIEKIQKKKSQKIYLKTKFPYLYAITTLGIDLGYLLLYRVQTRMSFIFNIATPFEAFAVLLIGIIILKEKVSYKVLIGIILSIAGVILIGA